jgi:uncharacterized protein (TIGR02266 family)
MPRDDSEGASRRNASRAGVVLQLQYRNAGHLLVSYCTNLSRGGLFLPARDPLAPGTRITLSLDVPGKAEQVTLAAQVRWIRQEDAADGPAGMGLAFENVDAALGAHIDGIVADFQPMEIVLIGERPRVIASLGAKVRSLVTCTTTHRAVDPDRAPTLTGVDLVIVDVDSAPEPSLRLLERLAEFERPPPRLALCDPKSGTVWSRAIALARVVKTPIESDALRKSVLETLTQVSVSDDS